MRRFFISVLVLNLLIEGLAAVSLIFSSPVGVFAENRPAGSEWSMIYGFAAFAIATAIFWLWPYRDDAAAVGSVMGMLATFHTALFIVLAVAGTQMAGMIMHAVMAGFCWLILFQRDRWCQ